MLIAAATVPAIYWLAGLLYNRRVALIAAALFAFNAYNVRYAQEARSYALFLLLATLSSGFLISFVREPTRRNWLGYVTVSVLAVYAHFYALLLVAAQWLALRALGVKSSPEFCTDRPAATGVDRDRACGSAFAALCGENRSRANPLDHTTRDSRCAGILRASGGGQQLGPPDHLRRRFFCCGDAARETIVRRRAGSGDQLEDLAGAVSSDLADLPRPADCFAVVGASGISGALCDLLPARSIDSGGGRAGSPAASVRAITEAVALRSPAAPAPQPAARPASEAERGRVE